MCILVTSYFMLIFSDWIPDDAKLKVKGSPNLKSTLGLTLLAIIIFYIAINLSILLREIIMQFKDKWRKRRTIKIRKKRR